jgi:uncharacterized protein YndB with AHSA1/START domain
MQRDYPAPPDQVFQAWTDVDLLRQWFGCGPDMLWNVHTWDVRVGGAIHVSLEFDHGPFEVRGQFLVVEPPSHLRYRWGEDQIVDVTIEAHGSGSRLTLEHSGLVTDEDCSVTNAGWTYALDQLGRLRSRVA